MTERFIALRLLLEATFASTKAGDGWGKYHYINPMDQPIVEQVYYNMLTEHESDLYHWFQQLKLHLNCVRENLRLLSMRYEVPETRKKDGL